MGVKGSELVVRGLFDNGVRDFFYLIGGPMSEAEGLAIDAGLRGIDVRDERAGTFAAIAYSRVARRPGVVMTCSGPGTINAVTGLAHAQADGAPVVVLGGSAARYNRGTGVFQEADQVAIMEPVTKWAHQVADPDSVPAAIARALHIATSGAPGPVYIDLPADILYGEGDADATSRARMTTRTLGDPRAIAAAVDVIERAERPVVIAGSGVYWSEAWGELRELVERAQIPFYTTPNARGLVEEDHPLSFNAARSTAFREADCMLVVGTRDNYVLNSLQPPVFSADSSLIVLNTNPEDISRNRVADVAIVADAKLGLRQLVEEIDRRGGKSAPADWRAQLADACEGATTRSQDERTSDEVPIHPLRLCAEIEAVLPRDAVFITDGAETIGFARRNVLAYSPGRSLSPGVFGTMGVGVPFAVGAKVAAPDAPVVTLTGDGAFAFHAMELDTAVRHGLGIVCIVANNGGWTGKRGRPGYDLAHSEYQHMADVVGCRGVKVTEPTAIRSALIDALEYAAMESKPALVNVIVSNARAGGRRFARQTRSGEAGGEYDAV